MWWPCYSQTWQVARRLHAHNDRAPWWVSFYKPPWYPPLRTLRSNGTAWTPWNACCTPVSRRAPAAKDPRRNRLLPRRRWAASLPHGRWQSIGAVGPDMVKLSHYEKCFTTRASGTCSRRKALFSSRAGVQQNLCVTCKFRTSCS